MKYGFIIRNVTDLRSRPDFKSERKNQLLYNEPIVIKSSRNGYAEISQADGYSGWVDEKAICLTSKSAYRDFIKAASVLIKSATCNVINIDNKSSFPRYLFYGTRLCPVRRQGRFLIVKNTGGGKFRILYNKQRPFGQKMSSINGRILVREAGKFIGTPYLWGGMTPFGFDCSGFVKLIMRSFGIELPRDSKDQARVGEKISRDKIKAGDLLFFTGHVALAVDKDKIIHASLGEGGVAVNSLNPSDGDFRQDLQETFIQARRMIP